MRSIVTGFIFSSLLFLFTGRSPAQENDAIPAVIPRPGTVQLKTGQFTLDENTQIVTNTTDEKVRWVVDYLLDRLSRSTGFNPEVRVSGEEKRPLNVVELRIAENQAGENTEGYTLDVRPEAVQICADAPAGLFYGVQSLIQLLPVEIESQQFMQGETWNVPCVHIIDEPVFQWRGVHLDVCRHFFPVAFIKKYIDLIALYKMNTFHWHLTEDQGWRIEIKKYPRLTELGAWRNQTMDDGLRHGGYYTQAEVREVVEYAKKRFITVVPEIEMPGHAMAALAAYPELSCTGGPFEVGTRWGVYEDVYCAGNDKTFAFLEDVLSEVVVLFPGEFFHIGGDECPKTRWQVCKKCQDRMRVEGLKNENELQSYFIRRIERFLNTKGKRLVGWDEILEGGLAPNATVMSWRGVNGGIEAARAGHDVVMSPTSHCYFDYYQALYGEPKAIGGFISLHKVYTFDPVPAELTPEEAKHVLGAQANVWTEYIEESDHVEYMLFPRLCALSEVVWSEKRHRNYGDFSRRMRSHYERLTHHHVHFRPLYR